MSISSQQQSTSSRTMDVIFAVLFYIVTSITMVLANKWVLTETPSLPLFFLWLQLVVAVVFLAGSHAIGLIHLPGPPAPSNTFDQTVASKCPFVSWQRGQRLWPLIVVNVVGLASNTLCLKYVDASVYQVARSLILPFTVILQWVGLRQASSISVLIACAVVCAGFFVGMFGDRPVAEKQHDGWSAFLGIFFGIFSSLTTSLHAIVIKSSLDVVKGNTMELAWYNNVFSALAMLPVVILMGELPGAISLFVDNRLFLPDQFRLEFASPLVRFLIGCGVTGIFGFLINLAGFFQIKVTSPVSHMICSAVRGVLQTILAVWLFHDILTSSRLMGIFLILTGSAAYTWIRSVESVAGEQSAAAHDKDVEIAVESKSTS